MLVIVFAFLVQFVFIVFDNCSGRFDTAYLVAIGIVQVIVSAGISLHVELYIHTIFLFDDDDDILEIAASFLTYVKIMMFYCQGKHNKTASGRLSGR